MAFKVGDKVRIYDDFQDSKDDGEFEIMEINGPRIVIRTITYKDNFKNGVAIPTEIVRTNMIYKVK